MIKIVLSALLMLSVSGFAKEAMPPELKERINLEVDNLKSSADSMYIQPAQMKIAAVQNKSKSDIEQIQRKASAEIQKVKSNENAQISNITAERDKQVSAMANKRYNQFGSEMKGAGYYDEYMGYLKQRLQEKGLMK